MKKETESNISLKENIILCNTLRLIVKNSNFKIKYQDLYKNGKLTEFGTIASMLFLITVTTKAFQIISKPSPLR